jgi:hypothetical protein
VAQVVVVELQAMVAQELHPQFKDLMAATQTAMVAIMVLVVVAAQVRRVQMELLP